MNKYLSLILLYNRASYKKIMIAVGAIPLCFLAIFLLRIGNPAEASPAMLVERAFGGFAAVLPFIVANLLVLVAVATSLGGEKSLKASCSTTGYTIRRLRMSPISSYITMFVYYLMLILIIWGVTVASLYAIGRAGLAMAGAADIDTKLALGLLRTEIGHALIPVAHPTLLGFNTVAVLALACECAKSCYLSWHNGTPSIGVVLVLIAMFVIWTYAGENHYILMALALLVPYTAVSFGDVIFREKRPKGDPFKANKYEGIMDLDSMEFSESVIDYEVNSPLENHEKKGDKKINLSWLRRRFMPPGINMERANNFFGMCIFLGIAEHMVFFFKYRIRLSVIKNSIKAITIDSGVKMPYFWDLQEHSYYGYLVGILLALFLQAYWNYKYYNKKTKSVYVMKRLPDQKEYSRTIWGAPAIQALFIAMIMVLHTVIDLCMYSFVTPKIALYSDYLAHILPF